MKRNKNKNKTVWLLFTIVFGIVLVVILVFENLNKDNFTKYTDDHQTVVLYNNNTFTATLSHNKVIQGTYIETDGGVILTSANQEVFAEITSNEEFIIPIEWEDGHCHNRVLRKIK